MYVTTWLIRDCGGATPPPPPPPLFGWSKKVHISTSITYRNNLPYILLSIFRVSPTNPQLVSDSMFIVLLLNERLDFNREIIEFQMLFLFSFVLGSVFHEDKDSSLNKFEGVFAQRHSFMKATYRRYA